ncbi:MAG: hypothetical protein QOJ37_2239 [Pseudonocardiales bacterium]|nr:hypothetical protein [Pseudonocardiales bacterium]
MALKTCHLLQAAIVATAVATLSTACSSSGGSAGKTTAAGTQSGTPAAAGSSVTISLAGGRLTAPDGHTLYYNTVDTASKIDCVGVCATNWPPLVGTPKAAPGIGKSDLSTATRPGGGVQVTYYGHPLYEFKADTTASDRKGDGVADGGGKWLVATPDQAAGATSGSSGSGASSSDDKGGSSGTASSANSGGGGYGYP